MHVLINLLWKRSNVMGQTNHTICAKDEQVFRFGDNRELRFDKDQSVRKSHINSHAHSITFDSLRHDKKLKEIPLTYINQKSFVNSTAG